MTMDHLELPNIKALFIPDPGYEFFDIDLSAADLRIVVWESNCQEMKSMLRAGLDPYTEIAKEFYHDPGITKKDPRRQTFKSFAHGCLTAGHEVLTQKGWVKIEDYDETKEIMVWEPKNWKTWFEVPEFMVRDFGVHFVKFEGQSYECEVTHDHRIPYTTDNKMRVGAASAIPASARLPMCGYFTGAQSISVVEARLLAAFQADGSMDKHGNVVFHFHKQRKMDRMRGLLECYIPDCFTESSNTFYIPHRFADFARWGKIAGAYLLKWDANALDAFLDELVYWDGSNSGTVLCHVSTTSKEHADWLQTIAKLRGYGSQVNLHRKEEETRKPLWYVSLNKRQYFNLSSGKKSEIYETEPRRVFCPKTSTGYFMVRKNGKIFVTGNTNYLGTAKGLAERLGLSVKEAESTQKWYFSKFPEIKKWQEGVKNQVLTRRMVKNVFGYRYYIFQKIEGTLFNQVIAWIPQSTVGCLINRIYMNIYDNLKEVQVLLQVHDSLAGQYPVAIAEQCRRRIIEEAQIQLPYDDPVIIPVGIKTSRESWGGCK